MNHARMMVTTGEVATMGSTTPLGVVESAHWKQPTPIAGPASAFARVHGAAPIGWLAARVKQHGWTQAEAASRCGVTQPRINDLLRGRVSRFSLDALVNIATALGCRVHFDPEAA